MRTSALLIALVAAAAVPRAARADAPPPWAVGVTDAQKADAQKLLDAGNALFLDKKYAEALEQYKRAVAIWDHPAIRFNIVRCLIQLDRSVDASDNLQLALEYGAAPLEEAVYAEALAYDKLLANQIGNLAVTCTQAGVAITLDGQPLLACPGAEARRVAPGSHQVIGTRTGYAPSAREVIVLGGKRADLDVELVPLAQAGILVHRWPTWIPWVVFGSALAVTGMGGVLELVASSDFRSYDDEVATVCPTGCSTKTDAAQVARLDRLQATARHVNDAGVAVLAAGLAATATGAVLLYANRGHTVYPDAALPVVMPLPGGGGAVSLVGRF